MAEHPHWRGASDKLRVEIALVCPRERFFQPSIEPIRTHQRHRQMA
jgi:hypothetical protein